MADNNDISLSEDVYKRQILQRFHKQYFEYYIHISRIYLILTNNFIQYKFKDKYEFDFNVI